MLQGLHSYLRDQKIPHFYEIRKLIAAFTITRNWILHWTS